MKTRILRVANNRSSARALHYFTTNDSLLLILTDKKLTPDCCFLIMKNINAIATVQIINKMKVEYAETFSMRDDFESL